MVFIIRGVEKHSYGHCVAGNRRKCISYMTTTATQCEYKKAALKTEKKLHNFYTPEMREKKNLRCFFFIAERGELIKVIYIL